VRKSFALHTQPHVAAIGEDVELLFTPEVMGDEFLDAYAELRRLQSEQGVDLENLAEADSRDVLRTMRALRSFLARLMMPESAEQFTRLDVVADGQTIASYHDLDEAYEHADTLSDAKVVDALRLPTRVLTELLEWSVELYGGERPTGSSSASATASRPAGMRGTGVSPSKASTRTRGR
jgi:hypothetical protein